jgi:hypothetical protein
MLANQPRLAAPHPPRQRHGRSAPRTTIKVADSQKLPSNNNEPERLAGRAARSSLEERRAV